MSLNEEQKRERSEYLEKNLLTTECSQGNPYVFTSYASDNWEKVFKEVVLPLQQTYGLRVYADKAFDKVNDRWIVPMLRNIRGADAVIAFVSQQYIESYACFLELLTAVNSKKPIIFISLQDNLHLGNTTDQPEIERGVKNEILNQGANLATNTNNTSNDLMRAMKSAYTSISTLLEQDALSRYDISDAFINFFRDASVNRKTPNDLKAIKRTINSVSREVFDKMLITRQEPETPVERVEPKISVERTVTAAEAPEPAVVVTETAAAQAAGTQSVAQEQPVQSTGSAWAAAPVVRVQNNLPRKENNMAVKSLVCGIIGVIGFWLLFPVIAAVAAIVLGASNNSKGYPNRKMAIAGIVLGVIGCLLTLVMLL